MSNLVVGPFLGELGWEMFSWQPYVRGMFFQGGFDKCIVYGVKGRDYLYDFAEYQEIERPKGTTPETNFINNYEDYRSEIDIMGNKIIGEQKQKQAGAEFQFLWFKNFPKINDPCYMGGRPNLIEQRKTHEKVFPILADSSQNHKLVCLCIRNRSLSDFRNWDFENWYNLADRLKKDYNVFIVGTIEEEGWKVPEGVVDLTNTTTINDCIDIFGDMDLMVGGSTGLLHLASRMGKAHLVWGTEKNRLRYGESNWFGASHKVYIDKAWMPGVDDIYSQVVNFLEKGKFDE